MTIQEMKRRKKELGLTNEMVAELSGVPLGTVQKVLAGVTASPRYDTLTALEKVFREKENPDTIGESAAAYQVKRQGEYTLEDYDALPAEHRAELIDGVIYDMGAPTSIHQMITLELGSILRNYIRDKKGKCLPMVSPVDVQLDRDDKTMVQPDVLVVCDQDKIVSRGICGAPDLIIEILSPSTWKKDIFLKAANTVQQVCGSTGWWIRTRKRSWSTIWRTK